MEQTEGTQSTPDLDRIMLEGHPAFDGVMPLEGDAVPGSAVTPGPDEAGTEKPAADKAAEGLAADAAAKEAAETARKTKENTSPETGSRFKSHEEAERGYKELQGKTTKAEQRAAELETELARIRDAGKVEEVLAKNKTDLITYATKRREQALEAIDGLDPDAADYRTQAASVLAAADADVLDYRDTLRVAGAETKTGQASAAGTDAADADAVVKHVQASIVKPEIGLEADDPLFWTFAGQAPTADAAGKPIPLDDQITWAVEKTKSYHNKLRGTDPAKREEEAAARSRTLQEQDLSLGRGGARPAGADKGAEKPVSLSDAIDGALEQRRL